MISLTMATLEVENKRIDEGEVDKEEIWYGLILAAGRARGKELNLKRVQYLSIGNE